MVSLGYGTTGSMPFDFVHSASCVFIQWRAEGCFSRWRTEKCASANVILITNLLNFCCRAPEEFNVSFTQQVLMLPQRVLCIFLTGKEDKSIPCWPTIWVGDKQDTFLPPSDGAMLSKEGHHFFSCGCERQPPHAHDDLILLGEKLCYFIGCPWRKQTLRSKGEKS